METDLAWAEVEWTGREEVNEIGPEHHEGAK